METGTWEQSEHWVTLRYRAALISGKRLDGQLNGCVVALLDDAGSGEMHYFPGGYNWAITDLRLQEVTFWDDAEGIRLLLNAAPGSNWTIEGISDDRLLIPAEPEKRWCWVVSYEETPRGPGEIWLYEIAAREECEDRLDEQQQIPGGWEGETESVFEFSWIPGDRDEVHELCKRRKGASAWMPAGVSIARHELH